MNQISGNTLFTALFSIIGGVGIYYIWKTLSDVKKKEKVERKAIKKSDLTLSDFALMTVVRYDYNGIEIAKVIVDYYKGEPISLRGFRTASADKSNYEIREEAYYFYLELKEQILKSKS